MKAETGHVGGSVLVEKIAFRGHPMVIALHPTTIEITTEDHLTRRGDCIIGIAAERGCAGLSPETRRAIASEGSMITIRLAVEGRSFELRARGDPRLTLADPHDIVIRKSDFVSDRTLALNADAAAKDIPRSMVRLLTDPGTVGHMEIEVGGHG